MLRRHLFSTYLCRQLIHPSSATGPLSHGDCSTLFPLSINAAVCLSFYRVLLCSFAYSKRCCHEDFKVHHTYCRIEKTCVVYFNATQPCHPRHKLCCLTKRVVCRVLYSVYKNWKEALGDVKFTQFLLRVHFDADSVVKEL